jgi:hypothetical protein
MFLQKLHYSYLQSHSSTQLDRAFWIHSPTSNLEVCFWWMLYPQQAQLVTYGDIVKKKKSNHISYKSMTKLLYFFIGTIRTLNTLLRNKDDWWWFCFLFLFYLLWNNNVIGKDGNMEHCLSHLACVCTSIAIEIKWGKMNCLLNTVTITDK